MLNVRSLLPNVKGDLEWNELPLKAVSPPAPGVCKLSLSLAEGIAFSLRAWRLNEMTTQAPSRCEVLFHDLQKVSPLPTENGILH